MIDPVNRQAHHLGADHPSHSNRPRCADHDGIEFLLHHILQHFENRWNEQGDIVVTGCIELANRREVLNTFPRGKVFRVTRNDCQVPFVPVSRIEKHLTGFGDAVHIEKRIREPGHFGFPLNPGPCFGPFDQIAFAVQTAANHHIRGENGRREHDEIMKQLRLLADTDNHLIQDIRRQIEDVAVVFLLRHQSFFVEGTKRDVVADDFANLFDQVQFRALWMPDIF